MSRAPGAGSTLSTAVDIRRSFLVGAVALLLASLYAVSVLADADWDPTVFVGFGEDATEIRSYAEERLGEISLRPQLGHDGRFFFVQANDPWLLNPGEHAELLDAPLYRSQRMLYPALAGGLGILSPAQIVWGMLIVNLIALGVGSFGVAVLAQELGGSALWGLAFLLNIGFTSELGIGGAGIVAGAAAFGSLIFVLRRELGTAVVLLTASALAREVMLLVAFGSAWYLWRRGERKSAAVVALVPGAVLAAWALYLRVRIDSGVGTPAGAFGVPFLGLIRAAQTWLSAPLDLIVGLAVLAILAVFLFRTVRSGNLLGWAFVGFVPMAFLLTDLVWNNYFDISRAIAPVITAFVLLAFVVPSASEDRP